MVFRGINRLLLKRLGIGFVLYGHGVVHKRKDDFIESLHMNLSDFKAVINYLIQFNFDFINMAQLIKISRQGFNYHKHWVHLTFDDGYKNIKDVVLPFLASKGIPFTVFVSTNHIESQERFYTYRLRCAIAHTKKAVTIPRTNVNLISGASLDQRKAAYKKVRDVFKKSSKKQMFEILSTVDSLLTSEEWKKYNDLYQADSVLSTEELRELSAHRLVTIGSHNASHIRLNALMTEDDIHHEMVISKQWLRDNLNIDNNLTYAYPSGTINDFSDLSKDICRIAGYQLGFTTIHNYVESNTDLYEIPRFSFPKSISKVRKLILMSLF
jgi:peptidoglycan/xylan/chitin deacetylase (PgdA/CDA1 family)